MKIKFGTILLGLLMVALLASGMLLAQQYQKPLGPAMAMAAQNVAAVAADAPTATAAPAATQSTAKFCGASGKLTILVVGSDADPYNPPIGADLVRYV